MIKDANVSKLANKLNEILGVQEMTSKLFTEQKQIQKQVDNQYTEELNEKEDLINKESLLNRQFLYGNLSLHNLHIWINILKVIFVLLSIIVLYLIIFKQKGNLLD